MAKYEGIEVFLTKGDIITSKKGMLNKSPISSKFIMTLQKTWKWLLGDNKKRRNRSEGDEVIKWRKLLS